MNAILLAGLLLAPPQAGQQGTTGRGSDAATPGQASASMPMVEGTWHIVYGEVDGRRLEGGAANTVTIRGNMLSFNQGGQQRTVRLHFGPNQMAWADLAGGEGGRGGQPGAASDRTGRTGTSDTQGGAAGTAGQGQAGRTGQTGLGAPGATAGMHRGVYIATPEYLCLSFEGGTGGLHPGTDTRPGAGTTGTGTTGRDTTGAGARPGTGQGAGAARDTAAGAGGRFERPTFVMILHKGGQAGREQGR
jgi:hypothetical protein